MSSKKGRRLSSKKGRRLSSKKGRRLYQLKVLFKKGGRLCYLRKLEDCVI